MEFQQIQQTVGILTPDETVTSTPIVTNPIGLIEQQNQNPGLEHINGMAESPASLSSSIMHAPPSPSASSMRGRSRVWSEFTVTEDGRKVACHRCGDFLAYSNSHSTSSMLKHLKRKHSLDLYPPVNGNEEGDANTGTNAGTGSVPAPVPGTSKSDAKLGTSHSTSSSSSIKKRKPTANKPVKKHIPKDAEEIDTSIQHGPLLFNDPCVRMKWTDHSETFLRTFSSIYSDESYTDVTLVVENQFFKAHRIILSSASEFFDECFKMTPAGQHPLIFLKDTKALEFRILLDFIYKGEVSIPPSLIPGLVKVGSDLKVRGLSDFVWNEQLANSVFQAKPQHQQQQQNTVSEIQASQNGTETRRFIQQVQAPQLIATTQQFAGSSASMSQSQSTPLRLAPVRTLIRQTIPQQQLTTAQQQQGGIQQPTRMYSRIVNIRPASATSTAASGVPGGTATGIVSSNGFQGQLITGDLSAVCSTVANSFPSMKRIRIVTSESRLSPQIRQVTGANTNVEGNGRIITGQSISQAPETVLMVTNEGETLLPSTQGGVTVLGQPNPAMTLPMDSQDIQSDEQDTIDSQLTDQQQLPPIITAITSQALQHQNDNANEAEEEPDEMVYSIAEMSDEGGDHDENEDLLHQDHEMTPDAPP